MDNCCEPIPSNSSCFSVAVERRRRDRINDMIKTLAQIVPGCQKKDSATGNVVGVSLAVWLCSKPSCIITGC